MDMDDMDIDMDMEDSAIDPNVRCTVCGEREFDLRAGFYFCRECGTKQEHMRAFEVDAEQQYREANVTKTQKLKKEKAEKPNLTSWECYNYILRGLVDELLQLGAKEEFKLITLQLWAAYLRRKEIAFFNKKQADLPKLGATFLKRDAHVLYNHIAKKPKARKKKASDKASSTGGDSSRDWRKSKRKLDESLYSATTDNSESKTSLISSSTGTTHHAIQLNFSSHARKAFKKLIPIQHLKKHEEDVEGQLTCHKFPPKISDLSDTALYMARTTIREMYTILAIALNLAEDEIQLVDLVRFIAEGHIGTKNVLQYFPENVIMHGKEILKDISFYRYTDKASYRTLRENIAIMAKLIKLQEYRRPNLIALSRRYINELNLPPEMATYVERLINLFPPEMNIRPTKVYPAYEARAMAYIIFVLKLFFGLDGHKEREISDAAKEINAAIHDASEHSQSRHAKLFVWSEWVEYVEMRKVIIAQYNSTYSQLFKVERTMSQQLEELGEVLRSKSQREVAVSDVARDISLGTEKIVSNIHCIMEQYKNNEENDTESEDPVSITFQPSFTPSDSYFKRIRLHTSINAESSTKKIQIPEFMRVDHTLRTFEPYLNARSLQDFLQGIDMRLRVKSIPCTEKRCYLGMFVSGREYIQNPHKADFKISEKEWLDNIIDEPFPEEVVFKKTLDCYEKQYMKKLESLALKRKIREFDDAIMSHVLAATNEDDNQLKPERNEFAFDAMSMTSIEIFSENNMEPIEGITLEGPRRNLDNMNVLESCKEEEEYVDEEDDDGFTGDKNAKPALTLVTSKMDYWLLIGYISELTDIKLKSMESKFPRSFFWLLETCAKMIHVDWGVLYDQLMAIEVIFGHGIEPLDDLKDCIRFKYLNKIKDVNLLVNRYRELW